MRNVPWNVNVFNSLKTVNQSMYQNSEYLTEKASELLYNMECCLCSGDGLTFETAFIASDFRVMERVLWVLGVSKADDRRYACGGITGIPLLANPFGVRRVFFAIGIKNEMPK